MSAVVRIDCTTRRKQSNIYITVNSKVILDRIKMGIKLGNLSKLKESIRKVDVAIFISTK